MRLLALILLLPSLLLAEWGPSNHNEWRDGENGKTIVGKPISNYDSAGVWRPVDNDWIVDGDSAYNNADWLKTVVHANGETRISITLGEETISVIRRLRRVGLINMTTQDTLDPFGPLVLGTPEQPIDSNVITWEPAGTGLRIETIKTNGAIRNRLTFKPAFLDAAVALYVNAGEPDGWGLANLISYEVDLPDSFFLNHPNVTKKKLAQWGRWAFGLTAQRMIFEGSDTLPPVWVRQHWKKIGSTLFCVEHIPMPVVAEVYNLWPDKEISHNDVVTIDETNIVDSEINDYVATGFNYGITQIVNISSRSSLGAKYQRVVHQVDHTIYTEGAGNIKACTLWQYQATEDLSGSATNALCFCPIAAANVWVEGEENGACNYNSIGVTWARRQCYDATGPCVNCSITNISWAGSVGCSTPTTDYLTVDTVVVDRTSTSDGWFGSDLTDMFTSWSNGDYTNSGVIMRNNYVATSGNEAIFQVRSTEYSGSEPYWEITWSVATGRRAKMLKGQQ